MTPEQRDIELRINAKNLSGKAVGDVVKGLKDVRKAIVEQSTAAVRGEADLKKLEQGLKQLDVAQGALAEQGKLIANYKKQSAALNTLEATLAKTSKEYQDYHQQVAQTGFVTQGQQAKLDRMAARIAGMAPKISQAKNALFGMSTEATRLGMDFTNLADAEAKLDNRTRILLRSIISLRDAHKSLAAVDSAARQRNEAAAAAALAQSQQAAAQAAQQQAHAQQALNSAQAAFNQANQVAEARRLAQAQAAAAQASLQQANATRQQAAVIAANAQVQANNTASTIRHAAATRTLEERVRGATGAVHPLKGALANVDAALTKSTAITGTNAKANREAQASYTALVAAQKSLFQVAGQVDGYQRQIEAVAKARMEHQKLRTELNQQSAAIRAAIQPTAQQIQSLQQLSSRLVSSRAALQQQIEAARQSQAVLREAGVATGRLAQEEQRLLQAASRTTSEMQRLTQAYGANASAANQAAAGGSAFNNSSREALSITQRLRGQLLGLAAAYVGIYGAANFAAGALDAFKNRAAMKIQIEVLADGDLDKANEIEQYLRGQVNRLGLDLKSTAKGYTSFAIAAKEAGHSQQEINYMFERFSELGLSMGKTPDEMQGMFKAFEQMMSKGTIQAEELRQQLGDRLPGAFNLMAQSMGISTKELGDLMQQGKVGAENLLKFAELADTKYGAAAEKATKGLIAQEGRMKTSFENWRAMIADNGLEAAYSELLGKLTDFFDSERGAEFAKSIGEAFAVLVNVLSWCVDNAELLTEAFKVLLALQIASWVAKGVVAFTALSQSVGGAIGVIKLLGSTGTWLTRIYAGIGAFFLGWKLGTWLYKEFKIVRLGASWMVQGVLSMFAILEKGVKTALAQLPHFAAVVGNAIAHAILTPLRLVVSTVATVAKSLGADDIGNSAAAAAALMDRTEKVKTNVEAIAVISSTALKDLGGELKAMDTEFTAIRQDIASGRDEVPEAVKGEKPPTDKTELDVDEAMKRYKEKEGKDDGKKKGAKKTDAEKAAEKAAKEAAKAESEREKAYAKGLEDRIKLEKQLTDKLADMEAKRNGKSIASMEDRRKAVEHEFKEMYETLDKISKEQKIVIGADTKTVERGGVRADAQGLKFQGGVNKNAHDAVFALAQLANQITGGQFAVSSMKRNNNGRSLHDKGLAFDMAMPANKNAYMAKDEFVAAMSQYGFLQGRDFFAQIEKKGQGNPGTGSVATGDHMHVEIKGAQIAAEIAKALVSATAVKVPGEKSQTVTVGGISAENATALKEKIDAEKEIRLREEEQKLNAESIKAAQEGLNKILDDRNTKLKLANEMQEQGLITEAELRVRVDEIMATTAPIAAQAAEDALKMAEALNGLDPMKMDQLKLSIAEFNREMQYTPQEMNFIKDTAGALDSMFNSMFESAAQGFAAMLTGTKSVSEGFRDILKSFVTFIGEFLIKMGQMIAQAILFKTIMTAMGLDGYMQVGAAIGQGVGMVGKRHSGGLVGDVGGVKSSVPMGLFASAPRYHSGGVVGLAANEVPIVAERGEEVITADNPRHINNIAAGQQGAQAAPPVLNVVNVIDPKEVMTQALSDNGGQNIIIDVMAKNRNKAKVALGI